MARHVLYPYTRLPTESVQWVRWGATRNNIPVDLDELAGQVDLHTQLAFTLEVIVDPQAVQSAGYDLDNVSVAAELVCTDTNLRCNVEVSFGWTSRNLFSASVVIEVGGAELGGSFQLEAAVVDEATKGMAKRLLDRRTEKVELDDRSNFPTVAYSFRDLALPEAPWFLEVSATESEDPMTNHVRLHLNTDLSHVRTLLDGKALDDVFWSLQKDIARSLIQETNRLLLKSPVNSIPESVRDYPESVLAAASNAARSLANCGLEEAIKLFREHPREFDLRLSAGSRYWGGKAQ